MCVNCFAQCLSQSKAALNSADYCFSSLSKLGKGSSLFPTEFQRALRNLLGQRNCLIGRKYLRIEQETIFRMLSYKETVSCSSFTQPDFSWAPGEARPSHDRGSSPRQLLQFIL